MINQIASTIPYLVVLSHVALAVLLFSLISKNKLALWVGQCALVLGLAVSIVAVGGSLFYSNAVGFEPCYLCWWQRIFIYPMLPLLGVALWQKDRGVFKYVLSLGLIDLVISLYHSYIQWGGSPLIPCDATASCSKLYVYAFGYVTIPTMSLTIALATTLLYWANRQYENSHTR